MLYRIDFRAMGCGMIAMLENSSPHTEDLLSQVPGWFEGWEQTLSRFRSDSELNSLNRAAGWPLKVSTTLWDVYREAEKAEKLSDGLVRVTMLKALELAGYDRSFDQLADERPANPRNSWTQAPSIQEVESERSTRTICLPADMRLDFGGVAKGWAAMKAAKRLGKHGPALVSAGGVMFITEKLAGDQPWPVTISDPFRPGEIITTVMIPQGGIATSGTDYRRWKQDGKWNHHILDPRTGQPAATDLTAVSVIAPTTTEAEMAAKTILILGSLQGMAWIEARPHLHALLVTQTGDIYCGNNMENYFWRP